MNEIAVVLTFDTEGPSAGKEGLAPDWETVEKNVSKLDTHYRSVLTDSYGNEAIYSWFMLDWVGIKPDDEEAVRRNTALGHHAVFDWYRSSLLCDERMQQTNDGLYWHYHHSNLDGSWGWNTDWSSHNLYEEVINKKIAERNFYPHVFASGGYVMDDACSRWIEEWIPFDYSSNAPIKTETYDWSHAPISWVPYHPSSNDYQEAGGQKRFLTRRRPTAGHYSKLELEEIELAFKEAEEGKKPILAVISHDYVESVGEEFHDLYKQLRVLGEKYPSVSFKNMNALDAMKWSAGISDPRSLTIKTEIGESGIDIHFSHAIFSHTPWIVETDKSGEHVRIEPEVLKEQISFRVMNSENQLMLGAVDHAGNTLIQKIT